MNEADYKLLILLKIKARKNKCYYLASIINHAIEELKKELINKDKKKLLIDIETVKRDDKI